MRRNMMATLLLSQGTPMILMGDEFGRTQGGNNNAYCQNNELTWLDWEEHSERDRAFQAFVEGLLRLRRNLPILRQTRFLHGQKIGTKGNQNIVWFKPDGGIMGPDDWGVAHAKTIGMLLCDAEEFRVLILLNAHHETVPFHLPASGIGSAWRTLVDTAEGSIEPEDAVRTPGEMFGLPARSLFMFTADEP
jgi:glycogen operon protein